MLFFWQLQSTKLCLVDWHPTSSTQNHEVQYVAKESLSLFKLGLMRIMVQLVKGDGRGYQSNWDGLYDIATQIAKT